MKANREGAARLVASLAADNGLGDSAEHRWAVGDPAALLGQIAAEEAADLIVVGARSRGRLRRGLESRLADELESETPVPVLIAPPSVSSSALTSTLMPARSIPLFWRVFAVNAGLLAADRGPAARDPGGDQRTDRAHAGADRCRRARHHRGCERRAAAASSGTPRASGPADGDGRPPPARRTAAGRPQRRGRPRRPGLQPDARPARKRASAERQARARRAGGRACRRSLATCTTRSASC